MTFVPARLESAIARLEALEDPSAREAARDAVSAVLELHGEGLSRLSSRLAEMGAEGARILRAVVEDEVVGSLLLLHGLHPLPIESRVSRALGRVRAARSGGADEMEVVSVDEGTVRLRVAGSESLRRAVTRAVAEAAPEVESIELVTPDPSVVPIGRLAGRSGSGHGRCELCGQAIASEHEHLFEIEHRRLKCACQGCSLLFDARDSKVRRVRRKVVELERLRISEEQWAALEVPVGLVFFSYSSSLDEVIAAYPGPAGITESVVPRAGWDDLIKDEALLRELDPDISALLINRLSARPAYHVLSIDECYRLVGIVRRRWQGLTGGHGPLAAIEEFFDGSRSPSHES